MRLPGEGLYVFTFPLRYLPSYDPVLAETKVSYHSMCREQVTPKSGRR